MMVKSTLIYCTAKGKKKKQSINYTKTARILLHHRTIRGKYPNRDGDSVMIKTQNKILVDLGFCSIQHPIWYNSIGNNQNY